MKIDEDGFAYHQVFEETQGVIQHDDDEIVNNPGQIFIDDLNKDYYVKNVVVFKIDEGYIITTVSRKYKYKMPNVDSTILNYSNRPPPDRITQYDYVADGLIIEPPQLKD